MASNYISVLEFVKSKRVAGQEDVSKYVLMEIAALFMICLTLSVVIFYGFSSFLLNLENYKSLTMNRILEISTGNIHRKS